MRKRRNALWLVCLLILALMPAGIISASESDTISEEDLSITAGSETSEEPIDSESDPEDSPYDYNPEWTITLNDFQLALHLSENDYSILADGGTEGYVRSLDRIGFTPEDAREMLEANASMMMLFPAEAVEVTDYILFFMNHGMYEEAENKNLSELTEEGASVVELFREDCKTILIPENTDKDVICEENALIGPLLWDVYTIPYDDHTGIFYVTIQNGHFLIIEGIYDEEQNKELVEKAVVNIIENAEILQEEDTSASQIDANTLINQTIGTDTLQLSDQAEITTFDIINYFPFGTPKETVRVALEKNYVVYENSGSDSNEFYVFYKMDSDENWQCFYEFDNHDLLISVAMAFVGEATYNELSRMFQRALDHITEKTGPFETDDQADIDLLREDKNAFIQKMDRGEIYITGKWTDAFGQEGEELYLTFSMLQGKPSLFLVFFAKGYPH